MTRSPRWHARRLAAPALVLLTVVGLSVAAQAAGRPGWRVAQNLGLHSGASDISAVSRTDVWVAGISGSAPESVFVERWNGRAWQAISVPRRFTDLSFGAVDDLSIAGASAKSAFVALTLSHNGLDPQQYGLVWNGHAWTTTKLASVAGPDGIAAFSGSDMWAFEDGSHSAYALRYNGQRWRRVPLPEYPRGTVTVLSADDIWLAGSARNPLGPPAPTVPVAMHWNGKAWRTLRLPSKVRAPHGGNAIPSTSIVGLGPSSLLALAGFPPPCCAGGLGKPGITVLRWNGRSWRVLAEDTRDRANGPVVSDGHGGMWIAATVGTTGPPNIVHYSAGKIGGQVLRVGGSSVQFFAMSVVQGTASVWAAGASKASLILRYVS